MKVSAGILLYRILTQLEVFLVHPGGPFFVKKNEGYWTIPKGELMPDETPLDAAVREFEEETSHKPQGPFIELQPILQKGGKKVHCWACKGNLNPANFTCNTFEMEWPPKSGKLQQFPEVDKAEWFTMEEAKIFINERQRSFLDELQSYLERL